LIDGNKAQVPCPVDSDGKHLKCLVLLMRQSPEQQMIATGEYYPFRIALWKAVRSALT